MAVRAHILPGLAPSAAWWSGSAPPESPSSAIGAAIVFSTSGAEFSIVLENGQPARLLASDPSYSYSASSMSIEFSCTCGQVIAVPEQMGGKKGKCPRCGSVLDVPFAGVPFAGGATSAGGDPGAGPPFAGAPQPAPADDKPCPVCGELIKVAAVKCRFCGEFLSGARPASAAQRNEPAFGGVPREVTDAANLAMVLGIIGLTACGLCAPFAAWKGMEARALARQHSFEPPSAATAGLIMGLVGSVMMLGVALFVGVWVAMGMP